MEWRSDGMVDNWMKKDDRFKTMVCLLAVLILSAGCKTTEAETRPVSWKQQSEYLAGVRDPRIFGLDICQTPAGVEIRGGGRMHPNQVEAQPMAAGEPPRPVVMLTGKFGIQWPVLLDCTASQSWFEFDTARQIGARPVGERDAQLVRPRGEEIAGCLSLVPALRLGQIHISSPLVFVRMANGPLGSFARGIDQPVPKGVIGWDLLKKMEQIVFDYDGGQVFLSTGPAAAPDPQQVLAELPLVQHAGACMVRGSVDGRETLILIDPAGDFELATEGGAAAGTVQLGDRLVLANPAVSASPGGTRMGARLLEKYQIMICPREGIVYIQNRMNGETE